jgi:hypothetical protein
MRVSFPQKKDVDIFFLANAPLLAIPTMVAVIIVKSDLPTIHVAHLQVNAILLKLVMARVLNVRTTNTSPICLAAVTGSSVRLACVRRATFNVVPAVSLIIFNVQAMASIVHAASNVNTVADASNSLDISATVRLVV